jgi:SAM-dependent methyltransferase
MDIGTGTAHVAEAVRTAGHDLVACDITDLRFVDEPLVLADGATLPFIDATFDAALLSTVLHHAPAASHAAMLSEGARVLRPGGRLLVLEDIYRNSFERAITRLVDAITNAELFGEPHSNRSLEDWIELVNRLDLRLIHTSESFVWFGFVRLRQALLVIERA